MTGCVFQVRVFYPYGTVKDGYRGTSELLARLDAGMFLLGNDYKVKVVTQASDGRQITFGPQDRPRR